MNAHRLACILAIVGGACWALRFLLTPDSGSEDSGSSLLFWAGAALLTVMGALFAVLAVRRAAPWLRLVVGVSGPLFGWMLLLASYGPSDSAGIRVTALHGVVGALAILVGGLRWRSGQPATSRHRGTHSH